MSLIRKGRRLQCLGVNLSSPVDDPTLLERGKYPILTNCRAYGVSPIECRPGLTSRYALSTFYPTHSAQRLSDPLSSQNPLVIGSGSELFLNTTAKDSAYSGNPLAFVQYQPDQSPYPWLYIADVNKLRKIKSDGTNYPVGIAPPLTEPTAALGATPTKDIDTLQATTNWSADNTILDNTGLSVVSRINTTVTAAIGDVAGGGAGWYTINPAAITNFLPGTFVTFGTTGGSSKFVQVVRAPSASTTVAAITYDSGSTGLCSIQPTAAVYLDVDCMVHLNGTEYVRVLSVTDAPDGTVQSFRCSTVGTIAATQVLVGVPSFRAYCDAAPTGTITRSAMQVKFLTNASGGVGYVTKSVGLANSDLSQISNRQLTPDDSMSLSFQMNNLNELVELKAYLNVDASDTTFTQNAYMWTVRPADIQKIIADEQTVISAQSTQLTNSAIGTVVGPNTAVYGPGAGGYTGEGYSGPLDKQPMVGLLMNPDTSYDPTGTPIGGGGGGDTGSVPQGTLGTIGNGQWIQILLKISDAVRIGSATGRTLQTVTGIRVSVNVTAVASTDTLQLDAWWVGGTYGPDVGDIGSPYVYRLRGYDTRTGAMSNPGPAMRLGGGVSPRRQAVTVSFSNLATASDPSWAQCNQVLVERYGGSDTNWRWIGAVTNDPTAPATLTFSDIYPDDWAATRPVLPENLGQPFVIVSGQLTGTCNVSGTTMTLLSNVLPLTLAAGNTVQINGVNYQTHNRPTSTSQVELEQSGGTQSGVAWVINAPVLIGQPLSAMWGPLDNFVLGTGDATNPGRLYWLNGNNPDAQDQASYIDVTAPSEPLLNGCLWDGKAYCWSTDRMFAVYPTFEGAILTGTQILGGTTQLISPFRALVIPNAQGLAARWAFCVGPKIWFLGRDGIYETTGGEPQSITDADLYQWFPHDGQPGKTVNGYAAPDLTYTHPSTTAADFRLTWGADWVYFHYRDTTGALGRACYDTIRKAWFIDSFGQSVVMTYYDQGENVTKGNASNYHLYLGGTASTGTDGVLYENVGTTDDSVAIACHLRTPSDDGGEPWLDKQWEDAILDCDRGGQSLTVTLGTNNYSTTVAPSTIISTGTGRSQYVVPAGQVLGRNLALDVAWSGAGPALYLWEPSALLHSYLTNTVATLAQTQGKPQYQHLRDGWFTYLSSSTVTVTVTIDDIDFAYTLPSTNGVMLKQYLVMQAVKGKVITVKLSGVGIRYLPSECAIRFRGWGETGPYTVSPLLMASEGRA